MAGVPREPWSGKGTISCLIWHHFPHWQPNLQAVWNIFADCEVANLQVMCSLQLGELCHRVGNPVIPTVLRNSLIS